MKSDTRIFEGRKLMNTNTNNIYRDVTMDNISEKNVGETVRIAGWIENIRDHGGVSFIDLRDMY